MNEPKVVLVVDDSVDDRYIARRRLSRQWQDSTVLEAKDGQHAIDLLESQHVMPDLIFLDINMPRMDGHEFLKQWYEIKGQQIPVVVMLTSSDQADDIRRAQAHSCVMHYLIKPITPANLEDVTHALGPPH